MLLNIFKDKPANEDYHTVHLLELVLERLSFCIEHHNYHIKICIINKDLLRQILVLMKSTHTFLVLGAIRFLRYKRRHNLLEVAVLELFKFVKSMYTYFVEYFDSRRSRRSKTRTTISRSGSRRWKRASVSTYTCSQ
ncbi:serine/threonine-protein phosphatase 4 regulatory subunit 3-like [Culex pipiens pallens]|uniref:serine/threonine-protein phosphatase 4 regulatory subunit 3-like n=1 Tax=Culex pipiens pallens TaxID=42434 RepID=UPI001953D28A|nr:serine/threonine-protein phosphatase 4 regulatory subunit 3-like [Culex pipiens pallens]